WTPLLDGPPERVTTTGPDTAPVGTRAVMLVLLHEMMEADWPAVNVTWPRRDARAHRLDRKNSIRLRDPGGQTARRAGHCRVPELDACYPRDVGEPRHARHRPATYDDLL